MSSLPGGQGPVGDAAAIGGLPRDASRATLRQRDRRRPRRLRGRTDPDRRDRHLRAPRGQRTAPPAAARLPADPPHVARRRATTGIPIHGGVRGPQRLRPERLPRLDAGPRALRQARHGGRHGRGDGAARLRPVRFAVAGHDRGGRVAYRLALDHPRRVDRIAVLDVSRPQKRGRGPTRASPSPSGPGRSWPSRHRCPSACWPRCRTR